MAGMRGRRSPFSRFQLTDSDNLMVQKSGEFPIQEIIQTRQVEKFLDGYSSVRFFLGRDNVREGNCCPLNENCWWLWETPL